MEAVKVVVVVQAELMEQEAAAVEVEQVVEEPMQVVKGVDMLVDMVVVKAVDPDMVVAAAAMLLENLLSSQFAKTIGFPILN
uniref:Putative ovule protein n=1 Tax=Solanum chacoense TaxID=4108 RepID=A0A0V0GNR4_SOLCH